MAVVKSPEVAAFEASLQAPFIESSPDLAAARLSLVTPLGRWCDLDSTSTRLWMASIILGTSVLTPAQASLALATAASASACLAAAASLRLEMAVFSAGAPATT